MNSAENLFNSMGYIKSLDDNNMIIYIKMIRENVVKRIDFRKNSKCFSSSCFDICGNDVSHGKISEDELHAIVKQCSELGWQI